MIFCVLRLLMLLKARIHCSEWFESQCSSGWASVVYVWCPIFLFITFQSQAYDAWCFKICSSHMCIPGL